MIFVVRRLGGRVALALLGDDMHQHRPAARVAHVLQDRQQVVEIVAVDRADIVEAEFLDKVPPVQKSLPYSSVRLALS